MPSKSKKKIFKSEYKRLRKMEKIKKLFIIVEKYLCYRGTKEQFIKYIWKH